MRPDQLIAWRDRLGFNKAEAARRLGIARNSLAAYEAGAQTVPIYIALACAALAYGLPPIGGEAAALEAAESPAKSPAEPALRRANPLQLRPLRDR